MRSNKSSTTLLVTDDGTGHDPEELEEAADNLEAVLDDPEAEAEDGGDGDEEEEEEERDREDEGEGEGEGEEEEENGDGEAAGDDEA